MSAIVTATAGWDTRSTGPLPNRWNRAPDATLPTPAISGTISSTSDSVASLRWCAFCICGTCVTSEAKQSPWTANAV